MNGNTFWPNGNLKIKGIFQDGSKNGEWVLYHENQTEISKLTVHINKIVYPLIVKNKDGVVVIEEKS